MSGILDPNYGVAEAKRGRLMKIVALSTLGVVLVAGILYFSFRNWRQEQVVKQFLTLLQQQKYQDAYKLWGCTPETPCKYYAPDKFNEDWGPSGLYKDISHATIEHVDVCGSGVVFDMSVPKAEPFGLWVESSTDVLSYAPWPRCPGPHLQVWEFLKSRFSGK